MSHTRPLNKDLLIQKEIVAPVSLSSSFWINKILFVLLCLFFFGFTITQYLNSFHSKCQNKAKLMDVLYT